MIDKMARLQNVSNCTWQLCAQSNNKTVRPHIRKV